MASQSSFTLSQLAAGGKGISSYAGLWSRQDQVKVREIEVESSDSKCTCIVLALLAIMAAAGSIALFFYSGDFTNHQVIAFATGFGILSIGFIGGICYRIVKYMQATKKLSEERAVIDNQEVKFEDALEKIMEAPVEQMQAVLDRLDSRINFIKFVHENFFTDDKAPLSQNQKLLIRCFNHPSDIGQLVQENYPLDPQFALEILMGMDPIAEITEQTAPTNKVISDLMIQVSRLSDEKYPALIKHPATLAHTLLENDLHPLDQIIAQMSDAQKTTFLKYLADEWERSDAATERGRGNKARIEQIVIISIKMIVDQSLVEQFVLPEGEAAPVPPAAQDLLTQVVRFPEIASRHINLSSEIVKNRVFLDALDNSLDPDHRTRYLQAITEREASYLFINTMSTAINHYKDALPELLKTLYKQQPRALYSARSAVHSDAMKEIAFLIFNMTEEDKQVFRNEEKKNRLFNNTDTVKLVDFAHTVQINRQEAVNTLNTNPERFVELVLNNPYLANQEEALLLLQEMQPIMIEKVVDTMDPNLSYTHYNSLINKLQSMIEGKTKETADDKLKTLLAIFRYAPDRSISFWDRTKFPTLTNNRETHSDWKLFRELAEEKKEAVWQAK